MAQTGQKLSDDRDQMSIQGFDYKEQAIGTSDTSAYTFFFKIFNASELHIYIQDSLGNIVFDGDGTDTTFLASVTFDPINGGGTVTLANPLGNGFILTIFLANDAPDQPTQFKYKDSLTMAAIERGLDVIAAALQRVAYLAQRALRLHDLDDISSFDMRMPVGLSNFPDGIITVNPTGDGFAVTASFADLIETLNEATALANAAANEATISATGAANAESAALDSASQAAADAAAAQAILNAVLAAAGSLPVHSGPFAAIVPGTNLDLPGEVTDHTAFTQMDFTARIRRGIAIFARQEFSIFYRNGAWEIAIGPDRYADAASDHNVTFTVNSGTGQINAAVPSDGGSNAVIDLYKVSWLI